MISLLLLLYEVSCTTNLSEDKDDFGSQLVEHLKSLVIEPHSYVEFENQKSNVMNEDWNDYFLNKSVLLIEIFDLPENEKLEVIEVLISKYFCEDMRFLSHLKKRIIIEQIFSYLIEKGYVTIKNDEVRAKIDTICGPMSLKNKNLIILNSYEIDKFSIKEFLKTNLCDTKKGSEYYKLSFLLFEYHPFAFLDYLLGLGYSSYEIEYSNFLVVIGKTKNTNLEFLKNFLADRVVDEFIDQNLKECLSQIKINIVIEYRENEREIRFLESKSIKYDIRSFKSLIVYMKYKINKQSSKNFKDIFKWQSVLKQHKFFKKPNSEENYTIRSKILFQKITVNKDIIYREFTSSKNQIARVLEIRNPNLLQNSNDYVYLIITLIPSMENDEHYILKIYRKSSAINTDNESRILAKNKIYFENTEKKNIENKIVDYFKKLLTIEKMCPLDCYFLEKDLLSKIWIKPCVFYLKFVEAKNYVFKSKSKANDIRNLNSQIMLCFPEKCHTKYYRFSYFLDNDYGTKVEINQDFDETTIRIFQYVDSISGNFLYICKEIDKIHDWPKFDFSEDLDGVIIIYKDEEYFYVFIYYSTLIRFDNPISEQCHVVSSCFYAIKRKDSTDKFSNNIYMRILRFKRKKTSVFAINLSKKI